MTTPKYIPSSELPDGCYYKCKQCGKDVNQHCLKDGKKEEGQEMPLGKCEYKDKHVLYAVAYEPKTNKARKKKIEATAKHLINQEAANWIAEVKQKTTGKLMQEDLDKIIAGYGNKLNPGNNYEVERLIRDLTKDVLGIYQKHAVKPVDNNGDHSDYYVGPHGILMPKSVSTSSINLVELIKEYIGYHSFNIGVSKLEQKRDISDSQKSSVVKYLELVQTLITEMGRDLDGFTLYDFDEDVLYRIQQYLEEHYAESTFDKILQDFIAFENWVNKEKFKGALPIKIFKRIKRKNPEPPEPDTLYKEEYLLLLGAKGKYNDHDIKYGFDIAAETGFRGANYINLKYSQITETADGKPGVLRVPDYKNNRRLNRKGNQLKYLHLACTKHLQDVLINEFDYKKNKNKDIYIIHPELNKTEKERESHLEPKFEREFQARVKNAGIERHITFTIMRNTVMTQNEIFTTQHGKEWASTFHSNPKNDRFYKAEIKKNMIFAGWELFPEK